MRNPALLLSVVATFVVACADDSSVAAGAGGGSQLASGAGGTGSSTSAGGATPAGGGGAGAGPCEPIAGATFASLPTVGPPTTSPPPATHGDLNLKMRGWVDAGGALALVDYAGATDAAAPRLFSIFADDHEPAIVANFAVRDWDWGAMVPGAPIADWEVTLTALAATPSEVLELPRSGYDIGQGFGARVLYLDDDSVTLKYTGEDDVVSGYTIHVVGICPDPALRDRYDADDAAGRVNLPALANDQPFARARGPSVLVAIRDTGAFMDPRSRKDWW